jgi:hypothetical protein
MKQFVLTGMLFFLFAFVGLTQPLRKDIIEKRLKSVTTTSYSNSDVKKKEVKTYYSITGTDSVLYINDEKAFVYTPILNEGRIVQLRREDMSGFLDEIHLYKYDTDGSYSIETITHGAGTIELNKYTQKHDCVLTVLESTDTILFKYNSLEKIERIIKVKKGKQEQIAFAQFDSRGNINKVNYGERVTIGFGLYKVNDKGLTEEIKQFAIEDKKELYMGKTNYKYEFY